MAALLELSILFPGEAPTRWKVAREAGSVRHLELLANGVPEAEPTKAAVTILALVASLAKHDRVTRGHSDRVRVFTDMIAEEMKLPKVDRDRLRWAALIHDIGKLDVPARLLRKPAKPTASEWRRLRMHPEVGARLTAPLASWLGEYAKVVVQHHEHFDGSGYPAGLTGNEISLGARIVGLADAFEVMTAPRPYKRAFSRVQALREVIECSGTHFDPDVVRALLAVSTPRLRRALGPASWIGQIPVVGTAPGGGIPAVATSVARGAGTVMLGGVASAVVAGGVGVGGVGVGGVGGGGLPPSGTDQPVTTMPYRPAAHDQSSTGSVVTSTGTMPVRNVAPLAPSPSPSSPAAVRSGAQSGVQPAASPSPTGSANSAGSDAVTNTVTNAVTSVTGTVDQLAGAVGSTVGQVTDGVGNTLDTLTGGLTDPVTSTVSGTVDSVTGGLTDTLSGLTGGSDPSSTASPSPSDGDTSSGGLLGGLLGQ